MGQGGEQVWEGNLAVVEEGKGHCASHAGMTKVKLSKSEENNAAFLEKRRASLERSLHRFSGCNLLLLMVSGFHGTGT